MRGMRLHTGCPPINSAGHRYAVSFYGVSLVRCVLIHAGSECPASESPRFVYDCNIREVTS